MEMESGRGATQSRGVTVKQTLFEIGDNDNNNNNNKKDEAVISE